MDQIIIYIAGALILALAGLLFYNFKKLKRHEKLNQTIIEENEKNFQLKKQLDFKVSENNKQLQILSIQKDSLNAEISTLNTEISNLKSNIFLMNTQAEEAAETFYNNQMKIAQEKLKNNEIVIEQEIQQKLNKLNLEYELKTKSLEELFNNKQLEYIEKEKELENQYSQLQSQVDAAVAAAMRAEEIRIENEFYKIQLTATDIEDIALLRQAARQISNPEVVNKIIWKCYYEKPTSDLIGRVVGSGVKTGIYKITEISTNKCYIGQAVKIGR